MSYYVLDKSYRCASPNILARRAVVRHSLSPNSVSIPPAANAGGFAGVTVHSQTEVGRAISVRKLGIAEVVAAGPIAVGAPVNIADNTGRVKAVSEAAGTKVEVIGFAETAAVSGGDIIEISIYPHQRTM